MLSTNCKYCAQQLNKPFIMSSVGNLGHILEYNLVGVKVYILCQLLSTIIVEMAINSFDPRESDRFHLAE